MNQSSVSKDHISRQSIQAKDLADEQASAREGNVSETSSQRAIRIAENFEIEKLSQKVILLRANHEAFDGNIMVQHNEAVYMVRKLILERAKNHWKDAKDVLTNYVLGMTSQKQRQLDDLFEQRCIDENGFELGEQYED